MKVGHTAIMPNTQQSSSRVSKCYVLWIYYLDDTDEEISRRVNVCLEGSFMLTLLTRAEPKTKAPLPAHFLTSCCCCYVQGLMWSDARLSC